MAFWKWYFSRRLHWNRHLGVNFGILLPTIFTVTVGEPSKLYWILLPVLIIVMNLIGLLVGYWDWRSFYRGQYGRR